MRFPERSKSKSVGRITRDVPERFRALPADVAADAAHAASWPRRRRASPSSAWRALTALAATAMSIPCDSASARAVDADFSSLLTFRSRETRSPVESPSVTAATLACSAASPTRASGLATPQRRRTTRGPRPFRRRRCDSRSWQSGPHLPRQARTSLGSVTSSYPRSSPGPPCSTRTTN